MFLEGGIKSGFGVKAYFVEYLQHRLPITSGIGDLAFRLFDSISVDKIEEMLIQFLIEYL